MSQNNSSQVTLNVVENWITLLEQCLNQVNIIEEETVPFGAICVFWGHLDAIETFIYARTSSQDYRAPTYESKGRSRGEWLKKKVLSDDPMKITRSDINYRHSEGSHIASITPLVHELWNTFTAMVTNRKVLISKAMIPCFYNLLNTIEFKFYTKISPYDPRGAGLLLVELDDVITSRTAVNEEAAIFSKPNSESHTSNMKQNSRESPSQSHLDIEQEVIHSPMNIARFIKKTNPQDSFDDSNVDSNLTRRPPYEHSNMQETQTDMFPELHPSSQLTNSDFPQQSTSIVADRSTLTRNVQSLHQVPYVTYQADSINISIPNFQNFSTTPLTLSLNSSSQSPSSLSGYNNKEDTSTEKFTFVEALKILYKEFVDHSDASTSQKSSKKSKSKESSLPEGPKRKRSKYYEDIKKQRLITQMFPREKKKSNIHRSYEIQASQLKAKKLD